MCSPPLATFALVAGEVTLSTGSRDESVGGHIVSSLRLQSSQTSDIASCPPRRIIGSEVQPFMWPL